MNDLILNSKIILGETSEKSKSAILKEYFVIVATGEPIQNGNLVHFRQQSGMPWAKTIQTGHWSNKQKKGKHLRI